MMADEPTWVELWRWVVAAWGSAALFMNLYLFVRVLRWSWEPGRFHRRPFHSRAAWPGAAAATLGVSVFFRVRDGVGSYDFNVGDVTALVPILSFTIAALWSARGIAELEEATDKLTDKNREEVNV